MMRLNWSVFKRDSWLFCFSLVGLAVPDQDHFFAVTGSQQLIFWGIYTPMTLRRQHDGLAQLRYPRLSPDTLAQRLRLHMWEIVSRCLVGAIVGGFLCLWQVVKGAVAGWRLTSSLSSWEHHQVFWDVDCNSKAKAGCCSGCVFLTKGHFLSNRIFYNWLASQRTYILHWKNCQEPII